MYLVDPILDPQRSEHIATALDQAVLIAVTDRTGSITYANEIFLTVTGYTSSELAADSVRLMEAEFQPAELDGGIEQVIQGGTAWRGELRFRAHNGGVVWLDVTLAPFTGADGAPQCVALAMDNTRRKRTESAWRASEEQLRQSQKIEAVGKLAGGIAHDFNNLLAVILLHTDLLLAQTPADARQHHRIEEIRAATEQAAVLTRQLLAFSRTQVMQPRILELNALVNDTARMLRRMIGEDIELHTQLEVEPARILADPEQLRQVILNLAVNARDAMPHGGRLAIETARTEIDADQAKSETPSGNYAVLQVRDTGHGMSRETIARAFEPFYSTRGPGRGSGLGLSTVYGIVRQSGGYIQIESTPGRGTTFRILLPLVLEAAVERGVAADEELYLGAETVLVVEDEAPVRRLACEVLNLHGYQVVAAQHGAEAIALVRDFTGPIHLLLSDVVMPKMGGPELASELAQMRPGLRVLFMSGYTGDRIGREGGEHGSSDREFIPKPFTRLELARRVREVLDGPKV